MAGMIEVARATVTIVPNMSGAQEEISSQLSSAASSAGTSAGTASGSNFVSALGRGLAGVGVVVAGATAAIGATGTALYNATAEAAAYGDEIDKTSQRLGMSATAYQEWDYVMQLAGTSMSENSAGFRTLTNQLDAAINGSESAAANFEALGLSMDDVANLSREEAFTAVITGLQGMEDSTERAALANDLLGRSAQTLTPLLNMSAEETQAAIDTANEYGMIMSDEAVSASAQFSDAITTVNATVTGLKNSMLSELMPSITTVANGLSKVLSGDESGIDDIQEGVSSLVGTINTVLPQFIDMGVGIITALIYGLTPMLPSLVESLVNGLNMVIVALLGALPSLIPVVTTGVLLITSTLIQNLPLIITSGMELLLALIEGIAEMLPELIPVIIESVMLICSTLLDHLGEIIVAAMEIIVAVVQGLTDAMPELIAMVPEIIVTICSTLLEHLPEIISAAFDIMVALGGGLVDSLPEVLNLIPDIISGILEEFAQLGIELAANALEWGGDMIQGLIDGIEGMIGDVAGAVGNVAGTIASYLHFSEPDVGPLSNFHTYAPDMIDLFTEGLEDGERQIQGTFEQVLSLPDPNTSSSLVADSSLYVNSDGSDSSITIPVYIGTEKIDNIILKSLRNNTYRRGG